MISTGITGTARQGTCAVERQQGAGENVDSRGAAALPGSPCGRGACAARPASSPIIFKREIGLDARADVERAVVEQRPAAVLALNTAQIGRDLRFKRRVGRLAKVMASGARIRREWWRRPQARRRNGRPAAAAPSSAVGGRTDARSSARQRDARSRSDLDRRYGSAADASMSVNATPPQSPSRPRR